MITLDQHSSVPDAWWLLRQAAYESIERNIEAGATQEGGQISPLDDEDSRAEKRTEALSAGGLALASFLRWVPSAHVLMPDGRTVVADPTLLGQVQSQPTLRHKCLNLYTGVLGQGLFSLEHAMAGFRENVRTTHALTKRWRFLSAMFCLAYVGMFIQGFDGLASLPSPASRAIYLSLLCVAAAIVAFSIHFFLACVSAIVAEASWAAAGKQAVAGYAGGRVLLPDLALMRFIQVYFGLKNFAPLEHALSAASPPDTDASQETSDDDDSDMSIETRIAFKIIAAHDGLAATGRKLLKSEAEEMFLPLLAGNRSAFSRAWREAARLRPELSKGGRPETP